jgi:TolA-binding protein
MAMDEYDLEEIKREIVESRSLTIKTNNLVNALAADLKSIAKRQQGYERRIVFNSATAYVVTIAVLFIALKLAWDARVDAVRAETKGTREKLDVLEKDLKSAQSREEAAQRGSRAASQFYDLIVNNKRRELIEQFDEVAKLPLTHTERAVFESATERARQELSLIAYQTGLDNVRTGRWHEATQALKESIQYKGDAAHSSQAKLQLGHSLRALGRQREAIPMLIQISEASVDKEVMDEATLLLAQCQIDIQAWNDAKNTLRAFVRRFPQSSHILEAKTKLADLSLHH